MIRVKNGVARFINNGDIVPANHLGYRTIPKDGFYQTTEATCGNSCSIGNPNPSCIDKCYSPEKCSVYFLKEIK